LKRQKEAVRSYAVRAGFEVVREFYDAAVSGADPIHERPGFVDLLRYLSSNGAQVVLVETASRFARDLAVQIAGHDLMKARGYELVPADAPDYFTDEIPACITRMSLLMTV
jgi:DNA invertase Pin-like site-specific DNA recombinase